MVLIRQSDMLHGMNADAGLSDETTAKVRCACGNWVKTETPNERVQCVCGNSFAVTVTEISTATDK